MTKLAIQISHKFEVGPIKAIINDKLKALKSKEITDRINSGTNGDFSLNVTFLDPEEGWPLVGFEMFSNPSRKADIFEWKLHEKAGMMSVNVQAQLESKALRAGVAPMIQKLGEKADLRLVALHFKGGTWEGFEAPINGQGEEDFKNWFRIEKWELK